MSIVILVGGTSEQGNAEHRYLVARFIERFGGEVTRIVTARPRQRPLLSRAKRMLKRGNYAERLARACYGGGYGPSPQQVASLLSDDRSGSRMPGGDRIRVVNSHNDEDSIALIRECNPRIIVVYGTSIIKRPVFDLAGEMTLNMHTGLSPYYRGDSTLFWPVFHDEPERLGVTIHQMAASVDGGDIAATAQVGYEPGDTEAHLFAKGVRIGTELYLNAVEQALAGTLALSPQDLSLGREFSWRDRTVAAEKQVLINLDRWARERGAAA